MVAARLTDGGRKPRADTGAHPISTVRRLEVEKGIHGPRMATLVATYVPKRGQTRANSHENALRAQAWAAIWLGGDLRTVPAAEIRLVLSCNVTRLCNAFPIRNAFGQPATHSLPAFLPEHELDLEIAPSGIECLPRFGQEVEAVRLGRVVRLVGLTYPKSAARTPHPWPLPFLLPFMIERSDGHFRNRPALVADDADGR